MSRLLAIASADWHIHKFRNFDKDGSRLNWALTAMKEICNVAMMEDVPLLFAGDWYHTNKEVETETHVRAMSSFNLLKPKLTLAISGNHDLSERNTLAHTSPSHLEAYKSLYFKLLEPNIMWLVGEPKYMVQGIPYMDNKKELFEEIEKLKTNTIPMEYKDAPKILLLHSDMPGAKTPEGYKVGHHEIPNNLDEFFKPWTWVLCGHIHMPQLLSNKVIMLGSPIHQNAGDAGIDMGYWKIYDDMVEFIPLKDYPKFIHSKEEGDEFFDYLVASDVPVVKEEVELGEFHSNQSRKKLADKYCTLKGIKSKAKRRALIKILNDAE